MQKRIQMCSLQRIKNFQKMNTHRTAGSAGSYYLHSFKQKSISFDDICEPSSNAVLKYLHMYPMYPTMNCHVGKPIDTIRSLTIITIKAKEQRFVPIKPTVTM